MELLFLPTLFRGTGAGTWRPAAFSRVPESIESCRVGASLSEDKRRRVGSQGWVRAGLKPAVNTNILPNFLFNLIKLIKYRYLIKLSELAFIHKFVTDMKIINYLF